MVNVNLAALSMATLRYSAQQQLMRLALMRYNRSDLSLRLRMGAYQFELGGVRYIYEGDTQDNCHLTVSTLEGRALLYDLGEECVADRAQLLEIYQLMQQETEYLAQERAALIRSNTPAAAESLL